MAARTIRQDGRGYYYRNLGYTGINPRLSQPKFILGTDRTLAEERSRRIEGLWKRLEEEHADNRQQGKPVWPAGALDMARSIARGDTTYPVTSDASESPDAYVVMVSTLAMFWPEVAFVPADKMKFLVGSAMLGHYGDQLQTKAEQLQTAAACTHFEASLFNAIAGQSSKPLKPIGGSLHQALDAYSQWIENEYFDCSENYVSDNGKTKIRQTKTLKSVLPDVPLSTLDYEKCDDLFGTLRKRPASKRYGTPMTKKSCGNYIGELSRFFQWLDTSTTFDWDLPAKFERLKRTPNELEGDIEKEAKDIPVYDLRQLETIYKYATPIERLFVLLGLNCAFGADQSGRLRVGELQFGEGEKRSFVGHLRRKKKVRGSHLLWRHTVVMLRWMLKRHNVPQATDRVAIRQNGTHYYGKTKGGNRRRDIPKLWQNLIDRIRKDDEEFPNYGFNSLRDTSTNFIRQFAGEELARLHCSHKHQSADKNLRAYSNPRRSALFKAQVKLERKLRSVFSAVPDPTKPNPQAYTSLGTIAQIKSLNEDGVPVPEITKILAVSPSTVYRHLKGAPPEISKRP